MTSLHARLTLLLAVVALGAVAAAIGLMGRAPAPAVADARAITWNDLMPDGDARAAAVAALGPVSEADWLAAEPPRSSSPSGTDPGDPLAGDAAPQMSLAAQPRADLDGARVALSGYMTPLEFDARETRAFLLVPYVGACIHVPAPPPNQIVLVETEEPVPVLDMWEPFTAVGTLRVQHLDTGIAQSAYVMTLERMVALDMAGGPEGDAGGADTR